MGLKELRRGLNDSVREWGNNRTSRITALTGRGLGDLLTTEVNFRRVGGTIGTVSPLILIYFGVSQQVDYTIPRLLATSAIAIVTHPITIPVMVFAGAYGYCLGEGIDRFLGDNKSTNTSYPRGINGKTLLCN